MAVVVVDEGWNGGEDVGVAERAVALAMLATPDIFPIPLHVAKDDEVEQTVVVEVDPGGGGGPLFAGRGGAAGAGGVRDVGEGAVAVVVVEPVATKGGDVKILKAIVVEVTDGDAHAVADALQTGFFGDVLEGAVLSLVVEAVPVCRA